MTIEWLSGFFDGEGCVRLELSHNGSHYPRLIISQKFPGVLEEIQKRFGGHVHYRSGSSGNCSSMSWNGSEALLLAERMLKHSFTKRDQLSVLLQAGMVEPDHRKPLVDLLCSLKATDTVAA